MNTSNTESLIFYTALLADAENEYKYVVDNPDLPGHESLLTQFTELVKSHKNNIDRLKKQIADSAQAKSDAEKVLKFLENMYEVLKHWIPEDVKKWIEQLIAAAKKVIELFK